MGVQKIDNIYAFQEWKGRLHISDETGGTHLLLKIGIVISYIFQVTHTQYNHNI